MAMVFFLGWGKIPVGEIYTVFSYKKLENYSQSQQSALARYRLCRSLKQKILLPQSPAKGD